MILKKLNKLLVITTLFVGIILLSACEEIFQSEIIGTWELEDFGDSTLASYETTWTFYSDQKVEIKNSPILGGVSSGVIAGDYEMDAKWVVTPIVIINNVNPNLDGKYQVDKLNNDILKMTRIEQYDTIGNFITEGAYLRKEFSKQ